MSAFRVVVVVFALALSVAAFAHEGHPHRFLGTLLSIENTQIEVKTTDGKTVVFRLNAKTVVQRGRTTARVTDLKVGERIVVSALPVAAGQVMAAINVQLRAPTPAAAATK